MALTKPATTIAIYPLNIIIIPLQHLFLDELETTIHGYLQAQHNGQVTLTGHHQSFQATHRIGVPRLSEFRRRHLWTFLT